MWYLRGPEACSGPRFVMGRRDDGDVQVTTGVYFYRLSVAGVVETRRMVLLK
jgi:hypothetical protein